MSVTHGEDAVLRQLETILRHPLFAKSQRLSGFLRFVVERALSGHAGEMKEYAIGVEVYGRSPDYSPQEDPIVRIMAGRLRAKLAEFYQEAGRHDPIVIELPRGGYVPRFVTRVPASAPVPPPKTFRLSVGREMETRQARVLWEAAWAGAGHAAGIAGEAGTGKTTFAEDFLAEVEAGAAFVARGRCSERLAEADAYAPVLELLDELRRKHLAAAQLLHDVAPVWHQLVAPGGEAVAKPASPERIRREFVAFLEALCGEKPVILFIDDLHWADASTCDLLAYLGQRMKTFRLLMIATYRPEALLAPGHPFLPVKLRAERAGVMREIALRMLTPADVERYIALRFPGHGFAPEFQAIVNERTEGHPLFLSDLLRYWADTGVVVERNGGWVLERSATELRRTVPAGTHAMIGAKLGNLGPQDRNILLRAAVQGVQFDSAVVAQVLSLDPVIVEERLRELESVHRLVHQVEEEDRPGLPVSVRYRFAHVLYQNALYASLTPSRRAVESLAVAGVLAGLAGDAPGALAAELAMLYETGRDSDNAARCFFKAARAAARVFAYPEAALLCERGLRALASLPESQQRDEQELLLTLTLGMALMSTRGYAAPEVESTYLRARELCLKLNELRRLVPVLWALHTGQTNAGRLTDALATAHEMRQAADTLGAKDAIVESWHALGTTLAFMGRLAEAREALERIFEIAPPGQHEFQASLYVLDPLVTSLSMLGRLLTLMGELEEGMRHAQESVALAQRLNHPHSQAYAVFWIGWILHTRGEAEQALPSLESASQLGRQHGLPLIVEWSRVVSGSALARLGEHERGLSEIRRSIERQDAMGSRLERPYCLMLWAEASLLAGDSREAVRLCDESLALAAQTAGGTFDSATHRVRAEALLALGFAPEASTALEQAIRTARQSGCRLLEDQARGLSQQAVA